MNKRLSRSLVVVLTLIALLAAGNLFNIPARMTVKAATTVSSIDTSNGRETMYVDGKPFFYNGIQWAFNGMTDWTASQLDPVYANAKADGFTVIAAQIGWDVIEPTRDTFDWTTVNNAIDLAYTHGLKTELLWFGSCVSASYAVAPSYALSTYQKVVNSSGQVVTDGGGKGYIHMDYTDPNLLAREQYVMAAMMNHVHDYIVSKGYPDVVVGVEVENEPTTVMFEDSSVPTDRSYSSYANSKWTSGGYTDTTHFNADVLWNYLNGMAQAVKTSNYSVWTRVNAAAWREGGAYWQDVVTDNENARNGSGTNLDFIGPDPYTTDPNSVYNTVTDTSTWNRGKNLAMIMENGGNATNTPQLIFNALAGDGRYHVYETNDTVGGLGMYTTDTTNHTVAPKSVVAADRSFNNMLLKDSSDLARLQGGGPQLQYFNRAFSTSSDTTQQTGGNSIRYVTSNGGGGIAAARDSGTLVFMSTTDSQFYVPSGLSISSLQQGYYDSNDNWVSQGNVSYSPSGSQQTFSINAYTAIRMTFSGGGGGSNLVQNPGFETGDLSGWSVWAGSDGSGAGTAYTQANGQAHSGVYHGVEWKSGPYEVSLYQCIPNVPNGTYTTSAWVESSGGQSAATFSIDDGNHNTLASLAIPSSQSWQLLSLPVVTITTGAACLTFYSHASANQWITFDDVVLVPTSSNLVQNAGFETGNLSNWTVWVPNGQSTSNAGVGSGGHSGAYGMFEWNQNSAYQISVYQCFTNIPNGTYTASAWTQGNGTQDMIVRDQPGGTVLATTTVPYDYTNWDQISTTAAITGGKACIEFYSNVGANVALRVDDVSFVHA